MLADWPSEELRNYRPDLDIPPDFDAFWKYTLDGMRADAREPDFVAYEAHLATVDVLDVTFSGFAGHPIRGWMLLPRHRDGPLPCVVEFNGYSGGRGLPHSHLFFSAAGYAHLLMDTRGQGSTVTPGATPDPDPIGAPAAPGFLTRGIATPETYFYRRVFADAVAAVDAARRHPLVDPTRIVVAGGSQGGGIALAAAALIPDLTGALIDVPFLCHFQYTLRSPNPGPYQEIVTYCRTHRDQAQAALETLRYFDGVHLATRATAPALFSVALMDTTCPPPSVYAAYNHYGAHHGGADKHISVWPFNGHEAGGEFQQRGQLPFLRELLHGATNRDPS